MQPKKKTSPIFWVALLGLGAAAFVLTTPDDAPKGTTKPRTTNKKAPPSSLFTAEDLKAKFARVNKPAQNAFMPVVRKASADGDGGAPNSLPAELTGGESGWAYTGTAAVDGKIQAVVENQSTGQGDFLSVGQKWKNARVVAVTESTLVLEGPSGQEVTVMMQEKLSSSSMVAGGFAPVNVSQGLQGPIGSVAVRPETPPATSASEGEGNAN
jgi:hypothetical protein